MKCFTCPVRAECEDYRQRSGSTYGMWAGKIHNKDDDDEEDQEKDYG